MIWKLCFSLLLALVMMMMPMSQAEAPSVASWGTNETPKKASLSHRPMTMPAAPKVAPKITTPRPRIKHPVSRSTKRFSVKSLEKIRLCIAQRESHNKPRARRHDGGTASGLFGYIDKSWNNFMGYRHAWQAPRHVQVEKFYRSWHYWEKRYGYWTINPWYYKGHKQCW